MLKVSLLVAFVVAMAVAAPASNNDFIYLGEATTVKESGIGIQSTTSAYYYMSRAKLPWTEAYFGCSTIDGTLVSIDSSAENAFVRNLILKEKLQDEFLWTAGAYDPGSDAFRWVTDGSFANIELFGSWAAGSPKRGSGMRMLFSNSLFGPTQWSTQSEGSSNAYVCESPF